MKDGCRPGDAAPVARRPWWRRNLGVPILIAAVCGRVYGRLSSTASDVLRAGETPRSDDVLVASVPGSGEALARVLEAAGSTKVPSLELGSTRRALATSTFKPIRSSAWLDAATARQLDTARRAANVEAAGVDIRLFVTWQPFGQTEVGPSNVTADFACSEEMPPYACLCPNCPTRWTRIVYVVERPTIAGCRIYGVDWATHVASYLRMPDATIELYDSRDDYVRSVAAPPSPLRRLLVVRDDDVRKFPGRTAASVFSWILDAAYRARLETSRDVARVDTRDFQVDADTITHRVRTTFGDEIRPSSMATDCDLRPSLDADLAHLLGFFVDATPSP